MKAIIQISIFFSVLITCKVFSQTPEIANELNQWNTDGNLVNENHFIGTQNDYPIKIKCNNIIIRYLLDQNSQILSGQIQASIFISNLFKS